MAGSETHELWKIFERGSLWEAEQEVQLGQRAAGTGVVRYLDARLEEGSGRPVVVMEALAARDLGSVIRDTGPLSLESTLRIATDLATVLARLHDAKNGAGLVHGDIKPSNVLWHDDGTSPSIVLVDFEHAVDIGGDAKHRGEGVFTGGTRGYAPPEADRGAAPSAAFDIYGLGVTVWQLLTAIAPSCDTPGDAGTHTAAAPKALREILADCTAEDPEQRPDAATLASRFQGLQRDHEDTALDHGFDAWRRGDRNAATAHIAEAGSTDDPERAQALRELCALSLPELDTSATTGDDDLTTQANAIHQRIGAIAERLAASPSCPTALDARRTAARDLAQLLSRVPAALHEFGREGAFERARDLLQATAAAARFAQDHDVALFVPGSSSRLLNPLQRDPAQYLVRAEAELEHVEQEYSGALATLESAEAQLDLATIEAVILELGRDGGGARTLVAQLRDRAHRLGFYLDRLALMAEAVNNFAEDLELAGAPVDLAPLREFLRRCAENAPDMIRSAVDDQGLDLRSLQRGLADLVRDFPRTEESVRAPSAAMERALADLSDTAWELVQDAERRLTVVPIPVRVLQSTLNRLDGWRLVNAFVDRPDRPRSDLIDSIETVRMRVDQARATRDRIAYGAEDAMARGHWTTALYDMERAVEQFAAEELDDGNGRESLADKFEKAKQRKAEIEQVMRRNVELASTFLALQDNPDSTTEARLELLEERRTALRFLVNNLQEDRGQRYQQDLRETEVLIVQEHADRAERQADQSDDPKVWVRVARQALDLLQSPVATGDGGAPGRVQRMLEHWQRRLEQAQAEIERRDDLARQERQLQSRRRLTQVLVGAAMLTLVVAVWQFGTVFAGGDDRADLATELEAVMSPALQATFDANGKPTFQETQELVVIGTVGHRIGRSDLFDSGLAAAAGALADATAALKDDANQIERFANAVRAFDRALPEDAEDALLRYGNRAWGLGALILAANGVDATPVIDLRCNRLTLPACARRP